MDRQLALGKNNHKISKNKNSTEIVVSIDSCMDTNRIDDWNHLFSFCNVAHCKERIRMSKNEKNMKTQ